MITKFTKLLGLGALHEPLPNGAATLRKKTLIFGENGRGKSTFVALLRSLSQGTGEVLRGRATIGGKYPLQAELLLGSTKHVFEHGGWNNPHEAISIFDSTFVNENVYAGNSVDAEQRKNLMHFALGSTGVKLANKVDSLSTQISELGRAERDLATKIQLEIVGGFSLEAFVNLPEPSADIDLQILSARASLRNQSEASVITSAQELSPIAFDAPSTEAIDRFLTASVLNISATAALRLKQHRAIVGVTNEWLAEGLAHSLGGDCPFCAQSLSSSELLEAYEQIFSESFQDHRRSLGTLQQSLASTVSVEIVESMRRIVELNESRLVVWIPFVSNLAVSFNLAEARNILVRGREVLHGLGVRKLQEPTDPINLTEDENEALVELQTLADRVADYNADVVLANAKIAVLKDSVVTPDVGAAQLRLDTLLNQKKCFTGAIRDDLQSWRKVREHKRNCENEKAQSRKDLDTYSAAIPGWLIKSVNTHLQGCGTYFKITSLKQVYTGAKPRFEYVIELRGRAVDLTGKKQDDIVFGTALSQGDKSALAFAFFLARLENDPTLNQQIVIFDDPLSSLDSCRRRYTRKKIADLANKVSQLIVLTHEEATIADIANLVNESECCVLQFKESADHSVIMTTSVKELTASDYVKCFDRMVHFLYGQGTAETVVKDIRPYLESNLKYRFPEYFKSEPLGTMIKQIRDSQAPSMLTHMKLHLHLLEEVNDYSIKHSHGDGALANTEKILDSDLRAVVNKTLDFARGFPEQSV